MIKKVVLFIALASLLTACNSSGAAAPTIDTNAIHTAAAETVIAEFTQTAAAIPPTVEATAHGGRHCHAACHPATHRYGGANQRSVCGYANRHYL